MSHGVQERTLQTLASFECFRLAGPLKGLSQFLVETPDLAPAAFRFFSALPGASGKLPNSDCRDEEYSQCYPVLWIGNRESVEGRKKEKIETEHRQHRCHEGRSASPKYRDEKHDQQKSQGHCSGIDPSPKRQ